MLKSRRAYTIVEVTIVLVLVAILAVFAMISMSSISHNRLINAAEKVAMDIRFAKNNALASGVWTGLRFFTASGTYDVYETDGTSDATVKHPEDQTQSYIVNIPADFDGVSISSVSFSGGNKVEFDPLGVPYNDKDGSALVLTGAVTLSAQSKVVTVFVHPRTGRVTLQ